MMTFKHCFTKIGDRYDREQSKSERPADAATEPEARTGRPARWPVEAWSAESAAEPEARTGRPARRPAKVMSSSEIQNPRFQPGVFICRGCLSRVGTMRSSLPRSMTSGRRLLEKALAVLQLFGVSTQRGILNLRLDVCSWPKDGVIGRPACG